MGHILLCFPWIHLDADIYCFRPWLFHSPGLLCSRTDGWHPPFYPFTGPVLRPHRRLASAFYPFTGPVLRPHRRLSSAFYPFTGLPQYSHSPLASGTVVAMQCGQITGTLGASAAFASSRICVCTWSRVSFSSCAIFTKF